MILKNKKIFIFLLAFAIAAISPVTAIASECTDGPTLGEISVIEAYTSAKGEITVAADAVDTDGISNIAVYFNNANGNSLSTNLFETKYKSDVNYNYSGKLKIPTNIPNGKYSLKKVVLIDKLGNISRYYPKDEVNANDNNSFALENIPNFNIVDDDNAPTVTKCVVDSSAIASGEKINVTINANDDISGFKNASLVFCSKITGKKLYCSISKDDKTENGVYKVELKIPDYEPSSNFELYKIIAKDLVGNSQTYCNSNEDDVDALTIACNFKVISNNIDTNPPVLAGVEASYAEADQDNINYKITVNASDDISGIDHITVRFKNLKNNRTVSKVLKSEDNNNGVFTGLLDISRYEPAGTFVLDNVMVMDIAENYQVYCRADDVKDNSTRLALTKQVAFEHKCNAEKIDDTAPILLSIAATPNTADIKDTIEVKAQITNDLTGVEEVMAQYQNYSGDIINFTLSESNGYFIGSEKGIKTKKSGTYRLVRVIVSDKAGNRRAYYEMPTDETDEKLTVSSTFTLEIK